MGEAEFDLIADFLSNKGKLYFNLPFPFQKWHILISQHNFYLNCQRGKSKQIF